MYCSNCGNKISGNSKICFFCGANREAETTEKMEVQKEEEIIQVETDEKNKNNQNAINNQPNMHQVPDHAGFKLRASAFIADGLILIAFFYGLALLLGSLFPNMATETSELFLLSDDFDNTTVQIIAIFIALGYHVGFHGSALQATPGKLMHGIVVTDVNGSRISYGRALLRYIGEIITSFTFLIGYLIVLVTPQKQTLHDLIASTYVVKK